KMSPAAATMVGQKTPVSRQRPLASISPTPRPSSVQTPMPAHESVLARHPAALNSRSSALPFAIAAILLLAFAGGAYAFRDRIPFLQQYFGNPAATASNDTSGTNVATTTAPATVTPPAPPAAPPPAPSTAPASPSTTDTNAAAANVAQAPA